MTEAVHTALYEALCVCLGLDPSSVEAASRIAPAYAEPENPVRPPRNRNILYYALEKEETPDGWAVAYPGAVKPSASPSSSVFCVSCYLLTVICYGPDAESTALKIRANLFLDEPRRILRRADVFPVPGAAQPAVLHEEEGSLWRQRADVTIPLRITTLLPVAASPTLQHPPKIVLNRD